MAIKISGNTVIDNDENLQNLNSATFTGTTSVKLPSGTTAERPGSPVNGMIRYNTTNSQTEIYANGEWKSPKNNIAATIRIPSELYAGINLYYITNFDQTKAYDISVINSNGTVTRENEVITYTAATTGTGGIVVNGRSLSDTVLPLPSSQAEFTTPGTTSWTVPSGVSNVSIVTVGGGGGGADDGDDGSSGANGGNLRYLNNIAVTTGETLTVQVGAGGAGADGNSNGSRGFDSYVSRDGVRLVSAAGGNGGVRGDNNSPAATNIGTNIGTGGDGGRGGATEGRGDGGGGGGAGGYSGNGGNGGGSTFIATPGSGGGGGGGRESTRDFNTGGGGGGVGIYGEGASGAVGSGLSGNGFGGSSGADGVTGLSDPNRGFGGAFGGGGGGASPQTGRVGGDGGSGAVRIIWGPGRAYPSTNTGDV